MTKRFVYMDSAATTEVYPEVVTEMLPYYLDKYGNPGGHYSIGEEAKRKVQESREKIAKTINADPKNIFFTSGGSESDNLAIRGIIDNYRQGHIITTTIEHKAVLNVCNYLNNNGFRVSFIEPDERGYINPSDIEDAIDNGTIIVSVMMVNNEIGTVQPVKEIAKICHKHGVLFHTDAVQAYGHMPIDVKDIGADLMSVSGHKFHAPKGTGFLYVKKPSLLSPLIFGGGQEGGLRGGTENVPGIVGLATAAEIANKNLVQNMNNITGLRDHMIERIIKEIPKATLNGSLVNRCSNNVNVCIEGIGGESLLVLLDMKGICASTGSACNSSDGKPSHVLKAIGLSDAQAKGSLRFTLDDNVTIEDADYTVDVLKDCVCQLRGV